MGDKEDLKSVESAVQQITLEANQLAPAHAQATSIPKIVSKTFEVCNVTTDVWIQIFSDRIMYGVSQIGGNIGNYLLCESRRNEVDPRAFEYQVSNLLGARDDALLEVYARRITELVAQESAGRHMIVILGISLDKARGRNPKVFMLLTTIMHQMYIEATSTTR
jgi:Proteasome assembly chaperone 3